METSFILQKGTMQIPCKLSQPDCGQLRRIVLGVHGLTGSTMDTIQRYLAEEMPLFSAATFRFDFPAHGENPQENLSVKDCLQTLLAVAKEARARYPQVEDLCIFATGYGAYITLLALPELLQLPGKLKLVIQTPLLHHSTILTMLGRTRQTLRVMDRIHLPTPRPLDITYRFYKGLEKRNVLTEQPIPMLILMGEEDEYVSTNDLHQFRELNPQARLVTIPGTNHRFLEDGAWDMVLDLTRDWFEIEQVLLTDCD